MEMEEIIEWNCKLYVGWMMLFDVEKEVLKELGELGNYGIEEKRDCGKLL